MVTGYPTWLVRRSFGKNRYQLATKSMKDFQGVAEPFLIDLKQTELFNEAWQKAQLLPFYEKWQRDHHLPPRITNIAELKTWPVLTKDDLRNNIDLVNQTPGVTASYRTSGSTGEPFNFPRGAGEFPDLYGTMWSFRSASGLRPFDPFLVVSTTLTNAAQSWSAQLKNRLNRIVKDIVGNSWNTAGFIATPEAADRALFTLKFTRPKYIIGFPSGIANIARRAEELKLSFPSLSHAILTSETIDSADIELIERALGVRVLIEYGATEIGVIAGSADESAAWPLKVNWWSSLVRLTPNQEILVTTLSTRVFPLINYALGDIIEAGNISPGGSVLTIGMVHGRTRDTVSIRTKQEELKEVFAREITYLVRDLEGVESVQVAQIDEGEIQLCIVAPKAEKRELTRKMSASLDRNQKDLLPEAITFRFVEAHISSARGKRGVLIDPAAVPAEGQIFNFDIQ